MENLSCYPDGCGREDMNLIFAPTAAALSTEKLFGRVSQVEIISRLFKISFRSVGKKPRVREYNHTYCMHYSSNIPSYNLNYMSTNKHTQKESLDIQSFRTNNGSNLSLKMQNNPNPVILTTYASQAPNYYLCMPSWVFQI